MASDAPTGSSLADRVSKPEETAPSTENAQTDGAAPQQGGSDLQEPEYTVEVKLSDLQADPNNPLFSVKNFEDLGLDPRILQGLSAMQFRKPSKIQERALPLLMGNPPKNLVGQSQSGTGKTAAFVLNIGTAVPADSNARPTRIEASVVVGTPGTVMDLIKKRIMVAAKLKVIVLDEADNMLDQQGLGDQCIRVKALLPRDIQVVLFSATFPAHVHQYASKFAPSANELTLQHEELTVEGIKQLYLDCASEEDKYKTLVQLYGLLTVGSSIIFVKTRASAVEIEKRMVAEGHTVASLTGGIEGSQRDQIIDRFRDGQAKVLITTNVLARGIDVSTVSMVINYDIPEIHQPAGRVRQADFQTYLHRIGRTGRFGRVGVSISFVSNREEWEMLNQIQKYFNTDIQRIDTQDWDEVEDIIKKTIKNTRAQGTFGR